MMFLSILLVDIGTDPDRPRPGRMWLRNRHRVHQRLCMAFPSSSTKARDPQFLEPFDPDRFASQVHIPRAQHAGFLFRIDPQRGGGRAVILVQSALNPDWDYAFHNARHLLAAPPVSKPLNPQFRRGMPYRFRLFANPVRKICKHSRDAEGNKFDEKWYKKRVPVPAEGLHQWLAGRSEPRCITDKRFVGKPRPGFKLVEIAVAQGGYVHVNRTGKQGKGHSYRSVLYEGVLEVTDPDAFRETLVRGIGPAKAFGFGLLSVAPVGAVSGAGSP